MKFVIIVPITFRLMGARDHPPCPAFPALVLFRIEMLFYLSLSLGHISTAIPNEISIIFSFSGFSINSIAMASFTGWLMADQRMGMGERRIKSRQAEGGERAKDHKKQKHKRISSIKLLFWHTGHQQDMCFPFFSNMS